MYTRAKAHTKYQQSSRKTVTQSYRGLNASQLPFVKNNNWLFVLKSEKGEAALKIYRLVSIAMLFILVCASIVAFSMGWLTRFSEVRPPFSFTAGGTQSYTLYQITYNNEDAATAPGQQNKTAIDDLGVGLTAGELVLDFDNLQFGAINNLVFLENENYVFYAVRIPKAMGDTVDLGITYGDIDKDGDHFTIYVTDKNTTSATYGQIVEYANADNLASIQAIETENDSTFISYSFALSGNAPEAYTTFASLDALFTEEAAALSNVNANDDPVTTTKIFDVAALNGDYYYLYIKLEPNIELYKHFIDYLWADMPFYLAYEVRVTLSVTPTVH